LVRGAAQIIPAGSGPNFSVRCRESTGATNETPFEISGEIPFDPKRLILGCFKPVYTMGRE
jgi:hypothetical protein